MSTSQQKQIEKIEKFLLEPLDVICPGSVVYLTIKNNTLDSYEEIRSLVDRTVRIISEKITDSERRKK
jgi:hypothetical protein